MTILTALATLYDRMAEAGEAPMAGYSVEKIGGEVVLDLDGHVVEINSTIASQGNRLVRKLLHVPAAVKRASNIKSNLLWDKTAYALGVIPLESDSGDVVPGQGKRTQREHQEFVALHKKRLEGTTDDGLVSVRNFLDNWQPDEFDKRGFPSAVLGENVVFRLDGDTEPGGRWRYVHQRPAAQELLKKEAGQKEKLCLVTGKYAPASRLHPQIKGVAGAQSSGASLVSFNEKAYESHGMSQGDNAPVSESAAFAYGTALNVLLAKDFGRSVRIGESTAVFWAETPGRKDAFSIEDMISKTLNPPEGDDDALNTLRSALQNVASGRSAEMPEFDPLTRIYILGLAPNAARLSVRFWYPGHFRDFAQNVTRFWEDLSFDPSPWKSPPAAWSLLYELAPKRVTKNISPLLGSEQAESLAAKADTKNIPPLLGGELMRAILTGSRYPGTLLSSVIARIRADGVINGGRAAICKAFISRNASKEKLPMSLDRENLNPAYRLGRLFAVLERIQQLALSSLNATIRDRYFASASATPARVFPVLVRNSTHHLALLRKGDKVGLASWLDRELGTIWSGIGADLPRSFNLEDQGRFVAGYYHQRFAKSPNHNEDMKQNSDSNEETL